MTMDELFRQGISSIIGSFGFSLLFGLKRSKLLLSTLGGFMVWGVYALVYSFAPDRLFFCNFIPALVGTLYAQILARVLKAPASMFIFTSLIVLVPGGMLYYSMRSLVLGNLVSGVSQMLDTIQVSVALAFGIVVIMALIKVINYIERYGHKYEEKFHNKRK